MCVAGDVSPEMSGEMMDPMLETCHIAHRPGQATRDNVDRPGPPPSLWCHQCDIHLWQLWRNVTWNENKN